MLAVKWMLRQYAVYWEYTGTDQYGRNTYSDPVEIRVRWEDSPEETIVLNGEKYVCRFHAYTDRDIPVGSFLLPLTSPDRIDDLINDYDVTAAFNSAFSFDFDSFAESPQKLRAYEILRSSKIPEIPARRMVYEAYG